MDGAQHAIDCKLQQLLQTMIDVEASDLHLVCGYRPTYRIHGRLRAAETADLDEATVRDMIDSVLPQRARESQDRPKNLDFSVAIDHGGTTHRFRTNLFIAHGRPGACVRHIPNQVPSFEWLTFPRTLADRLVHLSAGLVIMTGITGSGKTTSLAALVSLLNDEGGCRIITVEEPIEYVYPTRPDSVITQREVGTDVDSFYDGLKYGLRQDPDVVLVGEIRDRETAQMAISAAETGHLILTTMHTKDAKGAITRLVDLFPQESQDDVRTQLSLSLRYVVAQHLVPSTTPGERRALALEVMVVTDPVRAAIRFGKIESIDTAIQTGKRGGMVTLDDSLQSLLSAGRITLDTARRYAKDPDALVPPNHSSRGRAKTTA
ncbi:MAG: PilT/PilU family type 4a pilus ATPase [Phycisphaerales bacterium]|nr:MAG: PilT/PilU family type 4a pilus ATPase [Phycisphaerales bacterium]